MKTLKRSLCLVLALVMVVGLLAVGASAANFSDSDKVQYEVPVGVMTGMGIINGYDDGTFQPAKTVNRAEAAKMICYALIGKSAADGLAATAAPFADVPAGDWYAPYVSYLKTKGVIDGYDDGLYHANYPVTGIQLAKMLLTAVGYGKADEYVGEGFLTNTYADALSFGESSKSIFNGTKATDLTAAATREEAALYIYNAMCYFVQVTYSPGNIVFGVGPSYSKGTNKTMADARYGYAPTNVTTGMITGTTKSAGKTYVSLNGVASTYVYTPELAQYGHTYKLYTGTDDIVYYAEQLSKAYTVPESVDSAVKLYNALGSVVTWASATATPQFKNYVYTTDYAPVGASTTVSDTDFTTEDSIVGRTIIVYNNVITAVINSAKVTLNKVNTISTVLGSESITLSDLGQLSNGAIDRVDEYAGIAKDDVVLATALGGTPARYALTKVTPITGVYSSRAVTSSKVATYTIGGVAYKASSGIDDKTGLALVTPDKMVIGAEYKIYLDGAGNLIGGVGASATVSNYAYVAQFGQTATTGFDGTQVLTLAADIYFVDGTHDVYPIDVTTAGTAFKDATYGSGTATATTERELGVYDVNIASNGKAVIKLPAGDTAVPTSGTENKVDLNEIQVSKGFAKIGQSGTQVLYADANSIAFHVTGSYGIKTGATAFKVAVLTGIANFVTDSTDPFTQAYYKTTPGGVNILTAAVSTNAVVAPVTDNIVFFNGQYVDGSELVNGAIVTMRTYTVYTNGVATTITYKSGEIEAAGFYATGGTDLTSFSTNVSGSVEATVSYFGGTLTLATTGDVLVDGDTVIVDMTRAKEYNALVEAEKTVKVWVEYSVSTITGVKTAETIYVTSIA